MSLLKTSFSFVLVCLFASGLAMAASGPTYEEAPELQQLQPVFPDMVNIEVSSRNMDYWIDRYEVTQEDFKKIMGDNPSQFEKCGGRCPVEKVTWDEANEYCRRISKRLPTEEEWENAAKGGHEIQYATGSGELDCSNANWGRLGKCVGAEGPVAVGSYEPNPSGIYDMTGNVLEWTATRHERGGFVPRGGGWINNNPESLTVSYRVSFDGGRKPHVGFRCAR